MRASLALLMLLAVTPAYTADRAAFEDQMTAGMTAMMEDMHAPGYSGNADVDFLAMMTAHHRGAVEMARLVLLHGHDPLTRRLAEEIIAGQTAEIVAMVGRGRVTVRPGRGGGPAYRAWRAPRNDGCPSN